MTEVKAIYKFSERELSARLQQFESVFGTDWSAAPALAAHHGRPVIIATIARTGGMYLSALLEKNGFAEIDEYLNPYKSSAVGGWQSYIADLARTAEKAGKNYGLKLGIFDLIPFMTGRDFPRGFDGYNWVYLTRENIVDQAVSLLIAEKSNIWSVRAGVNVELPPLSSDDFSSESIEDRIAVIIEDMRRWEAFFALNGILPIRFTYEELCEHPGTTVAKVLAASGMSVPTALQETVAISVQRNELNAAVVAKFLLKNTVPD